MSINEAITHCLEVADGHTEQGRCPECAMEHRQLAEWLRDYKRLKEQEPCDVFDEYGNYKYLSDVELTEPNTATSMPCGDAISRQAVLDITWEEPSYTDALNVLTEVRDKVKALPSVNPQPQPKTGYWIEVIDEIDSLGNKTWHHKCSICGNEDSGWGDFKYCPNCGAKMVEPQGEVQNDD